MDKRVGLSLVLAVSLGVGDAVLRSARSIQQAPPRRLDTPELAEGQSATSLGDGRWLLIGGKTGAGLNAEVSVWDAVAGGTVVGQLRQARGWHSSTILPDGRVLVFGGRDPRGEVLAGGELFDLATGRTDPLATTLPPRASHTATLVIDGRVVFAGGLSATGDAMSTVEVWDSASDTVERFPQRLAVARYGHSASLLPNGVVLLEGGFDASNTALGSAELVDLDAQLVTLVGEFSLPPDTAPPRLEASVPADGALEVRTDVHIGLRFSKALLASSLNGDTVRLRGASGLIDADIIAAEQGMLAFIMPDRPLAAGESHTLTIEGAVDQGGLSLPLVTIRFTTKGPAEVETIDSSPDKAAAKTRDVTDGGSEGSEPDQDASDLRALTRPGRILRPPLQAPPGQTAISGQVLRLNGKPLQGIQFSVGSLSTHSDETGRFLLTGIDAGHVEMRIDGGRKHGTYEVGVDVIGGQTNVLPYASWLPRIDWANAVELASPTEAEVVVTSPRLPGLEMRIPRHSVLRGHDGAAVTQVSLTPIPVDRPPFPLAKNVTVPIYFTAQPGGTYVLNDYGKGARLVYPNRRHQPPWTRFKFWHYDPEDRGWFVYGLGTATENGQQVEPDPGVGFYEFTGAMLGDPDWAPEEEPIDCPSEGDPVNLSSGLFVLENTDLTLNDVVPVHLTRTYRPNDSRGRAFGVGTTHPYDIFLVGAEGEYQYAELILPDGSRVHFDRISPGTGFSDAVLTHTKEPGRFYGSRIVWDGQGWQLTLRDGTVYSFPVSDQSFVTRPADAGLLEIRDRFGNSIRMTRDTTGSSNGRGGNLLRITSPNGRWIKFTYETVPGSSPTEYRIEAATDNIGRRVSYYYDSLNRLVEVENPEGGVTTYTYAGTSDRLETIRDARQNAECPPPCPSPPIVTNEFRADGKVSRQTYADGHILEFSYSISNGMVTQTTVEKPGGATRTVFYNSDGYCVRDTVATPTGTRDVIYTRDETSNFRTSRREDLTEGPPETSRWTTFEYEFTGDLSKTTRAAFTPDALETSFTYTLFGQLASIEDSLNHLTTFEYDSLDPTARLKSITDASGRKTSFSFDSHGQLAAYDVPVMASDPSPVQQTTTLTYDRGILSSTIDPTGATTRHSIDGAGRTRVYENALGQATRYEYDTADRITKIISPSGTATTLSYDANGNLKAVVDALGNATAYEYDVLNRLVSRTDPLLRAETFEYDDAGNQTRFRDRRGVLTTYEYDGFGQRTRATFGDDELGGFESRIDYTYDLGGRVRLTRDSAPGRPDILTTTDYDAFDRVTTESTADGEVAYSYEGERRRSMAISGQPGLCYEYDASDRVVGVREGGCSDPQVVTIAYDGAGRREQVTLPNGVTQSYSYDAVSRITGIEYAAGAQPLGDLSYAYDAAGKRITVGGTFGRVRLPSAIPAAAYDAASQLLDWAGATVLHDANGNLTADGTSTYLWNARNQLVSISGPVAAAFSYDAWRRRSSKSSNGLTTRYLYDGLNPIREISATGDISASLLTGIEIDEYVARTLPAVPGSRRTFLTDGLGSTIALTDDDRSVTTEYSYEPYGAAEVSGVNDSNGFTYTGREDDGSSGLYYYRARYYSPTWGRFISEDPLGLRAGPNPYTYVADSPTNGSDPLGLVVKAVGGGFTYAPPFWGRMHGGPTGSLTLAWDDQGNYGIVLCGGTYAGAGGGFLAGVDAQRSPQSASLCEFASGDPSIQVTLGYANQYGWSASLPISDGASWEGMVGGGWGYWSGGITTTSCRLLWSSIPCPCE
jgi:RHS repeat-associated protein